MQFVQVKEARSPQTSQSGSAFGGGRADAPADARADVATAADAADERADDTAADAADERADATAADAATAAEEAVDGDVPVAVSAFFFSIFFDMVIVWCSDDE